MYGYRSAAITSPATMTSDLRKNTIRSPSLCADGSFHISIGSPPYQKFFRAVKKVSVGQSSTTRDGGLARRRAHAGPAPSERR